MECLNTSLNTARYVNMEKYTSKYDMLNKVATDYWIYGEYGDGFGKPLNAFFTPREGDDLYSGRSFFMLLRRANAVKV